MLGVLGFFVCFALFFGGVGWGGVVVCNVKGRTQYLTHAKLEPSPQAKPQIKQACWPCVLLATQETGVRGPLSPGVEGNRMRLYLSQRHADLGCTCCDLSTCEMKAGESGVQVQPGLNEPPFQNKHKQKRHPPNQLNLKCLND